MRAFWVASFSSSHAWPNLAALLMLLSFMPHKTLPLAEPSRSSSTSLSSPMQTSTSSSTWKPTGAASPLKSSNCWGRSTQSTAHRRSEGHHYADLDSKSAYHYIIQDSVYMYFQYIHTYTCVYFPYIRTQYICKYTQTYIHMYICKYIRTLSHTYVHVYTALIVLVRRLTQLQANQELLHQPYSLGPAAYWVSRYQC